MYRKKGANMTVKEVLARMKNQEVTYTPTVYASSDIIGAKKILERLLNNPVRAAISSVKEAVTEDLEY